MGCGPGGVPFILLAQEKLKTIESNPDPAKLGTCMAKAHLSLSHDLTIKGGPKSRALSIRDILKYRGAEIVVPMAGDIKLVWGTASKPGFRNIDIDTGKVKGLFLKSNGG